MSFEDVSVRMSGDRLVAMPANAVRATGDPALFNQYGVILVNPARFPHVKRIEGQAFIDWLVSAKGQEAIARFKIDGQQLFYPNASSGR